MTIKELSQLYHLNREIEMDQQRLADLDDEIRRDEDRLARLEMKATSVSGPNYDGMPKAPSYAARFNAWHTIQNMGALYTNLFINSKEDCYGLLQNPVC